MTHSNEQKKVTLLPALWPHSESWVKFLKGGLAINSLEERLGSLLPDPDMWTLTQPNLFWKKVPSCKTTETSGSDEVNGETKPNTTLPNGLLYAALNQYENIVGAGGYSVVAKQNVLRTLVRFLGKNFSLYRNIFLTLCRVTVMQGTGLIFRFFSIFFLCAHWHVEKADADGLLKYQVPLEERSGR